MKSMRVRHVVHVGQEWEAELKQHGSCKRMKSLLAGTGRRAAARSLADLARNDCMVDL